MAKIVDYRKSAFSTDKVLDSGKYIGKSSYWRLYAIENLFRVLIHSVLSAEIDPNWWPVVIDGKKNKTVQSVKQDYLKQPGSTLPGAHDIYFLFLSDLNKIIAAQSGYFIKSIPNIDEWIIKLEQIRLPRNIVGHMNWPSASDRTRIDQTYREAKIMMQKFNRSGVPIIIP